MGFPGNKIVLQSCFRPDMKSKIESICIWYRNFWSIYLLWKGHWGVHNFCWKTKKENLAKVAPQRFEVTLKYHNDTIWVQTLTSWYAWSTITQNTEHVIMFLSFHHLVLFSLQKPLFSYTPVHGVSLAGNADTLPRLYKDYA